MALLQGQIQNAVPQVRGTGPQNFFQLPLTELAVSEVMPRYAALAWSGDLFTAYAAAQATSLVGTAMVGLQLWNGSPVSGTGAVNLVLLKVGGAVIATSATQTGVVLASGTGQVSAPTGQTAATRVGNNLIGGRAPAALALNAGTFTNAPTAFMTLLHNTAAIATTGEDTGYQLDLEGSIIVPPQCYVCFAAIGAAGAASSNQHHIMWAELPV
jgi:hypothetical protein